MHPLALRNSQSALTFGQIIAVQRNGSAWSTYLVGAGRKRLPIEIAVPPEVSAEELSQYLNDIYHEDATSINGDVFEVSR